MDVLSLIEKWDAEAGNDYGRTLRRVRLAIQVVTTACERPDFRVWAGGVISGNDLSLSSAERMTAKMYMFSGHGTRNFSSINHAAEHASAAWRNLLVGQEEKAASCASHAIRLVQWEKPDSIRPYYSALMLA